MKERLKLAEQKRNVIILAIKSNMEENGSIENSKIICSQVKERYNLEVNSKLVN